MKTIIKGNQELLYFNRIQIQQIDEDGWIHPKEKLDKDSTISISEKTMTIKTENRSEVVIEDLKQISTNYYSGSFKSNPVVIVRSNTDMVFLFKNELKETISIEIFK